MKKRSSKKWGKVGAPKSPKRRSWLASIRRKTTKRGRRKSKR